MIVILVLTVIVLVIILSGVRFAIDKAKLGVPGPYPLPILGNALHLGKDSTKLMQMVARLVQQYGDVVLFYALSNRYLHLRHPKDFEEVMSSTEYITKGESYKYLHPWLGQGLLTSTGHRWKSHRKLLTPAFHFNILQTFLQFFLKNQKVLIAKLKNMADGSSLDLFPIIALVALDNVAESAMGVSVNAQSNSESEYVKAIADISEIIMMRGANPILLLCNSVFHLLPSRAKHDKALRILHSQTNNVIQTRHELLNEPQSSTATDFDHAELGIKKKSPFLDILLQSQVDGKNLDMESIREEVDTFMFEGHDTTTSAICFTLYCISNNKEVQEKILAEQRQLFEDDFERDPTYSDLYKMKYLELVIKESLRLYPSVPFISRLLTKDSVIAGYAVPKDTSILMDIFHTQRDARFFENPDEFRPERFLETSNQSSVYNWIPFSAGPRNCIGQKFAMMELKVVVSSIIKQFQVLPSGIEPDLCSDLILRSKNGIHVCLLPR